MEAAGKSKDEIMTELTSILSLPQELAERYYNQVVPA